MQAAAYARGPRNGEIDWMESLLEMASIRDEDLAGIELAEDLKSCLPSCYEYCSKITAYHSKSFYMASGLLGKEKRDAVRALYAFCRTTDDIVDMSSNQQASLLSRWRQDITETAIRYNDPVVIAWADTRQNFGIPDTYIRQLIDGVEMDLHMTRYENFRELTRYCYGVASTVGLMSMHIIGYRNQGALPYAIKLGVALQMTNILRDIEEDWHRGRIYLPRDEMEAFGIDESYLENKVNDARWKDFMKFQIGRTRRLYSEAWPGIEMLNADGRFAIAAAATFYKKILDKIEQKDYDVFNHRAALSKWEKLARIPDLVVKYRYASSLNSLLS